MQSPSVSTTNPDPSDPNKPVARTSTEYVNGNGKRMRIIVSGNQREDIDVDLYIEALLTVAQEIVGNSKAKTNNENPNLVSAPQLSASTFVRFGH